MSSTLTESLLACGIKPQKAILVLSDVLALVGTVGLIFAVRALFGDLDSTIYHWVLPLLLLAPLLGAPLGLYQSVMLPPHREVKATFTLVSLIYGIILAVLFLGKTGDMYSRLVLLGGWAGSVLTVPLLRGFCRRRFCRQSWWGKPLIIMDRSRNGRDLWHYLKHHPERGLNPVDIFDLPNDLEDVRVLLEKAAHKRPDALALLILRAGTTEKIDYVTEVNRWFNKLLIIPHFGTGFRRYWMTPRDLGHETGFLLCQNLHDKRRLAVKRAIDLLFCLLVLPFLLPLGLVLGLCIRLDSKGPVLYCQKRIGQEGKDLKIFKFRTMVADADTVLQQYLAENPHLREEWENDHKLKDDPRVTRMGRFLRKTSLDELPQLLNVVTGGMSVVGPRPVVAAEIAKYGDVFDEYCRVKPGITGLWQISGRNNTTYEERVAYDHYYINNWSVWMDLWIIGKTVPVVITGYGAY